MLPAPAPGEDPKDHESHLGPESCLWVPCWRHADAATGLDLAPRSQGAVPVTAAQQTMVLVSGLRWFPTRYLRDRVPSTADPRAVPARLSTRGEGGGGLQPCCCWRSSLCVLMAAHTRGRVLPARASQVCCDGSTGSAHPVWMSLSWTWASEPYHVKSWLMVLQLGPLLPVSGWDQGICPWRSVSLGYNGKVQGVTALDKEVPSWFFALCISQGCLLLLWPRGFTVYIFQSQELWIQYL